MPPTQFDLSGLYDEHSLKALVAKPLAELCVQVIASNFKHRPTLRGIPPRYVSAVTELLPTTLPLDVTGPLIDDEEYWERCAPAPVRLSGGVRPAQDRDGGADSGAEHQQGLHLLAPARAVPGARRHGDALSAPTAALQPAAHIWGQTDWHGVSRHWVDPLTPGLRRGSAWAQQGAARTGGASGAPHASCAVVAVAGNPLSGAAWLL
eukprot:scaffold4925_cov125-Isochrysis_galbana.AAC.8